MNNNYLVVNNGMLRKKISPKMVFKRCCNIIICNCLDLWMIINKCKTSTSPPAMTKVSQPCEITLSTSRGRHWRYTAGTSGGLNSSTLVIYVFFLNSKPYIYSKKINCYIKPCSLTPSYSD